MIAAAVVTAGVLLWALVRRRKARSVDGAAERAPWVPVAPRRTVPYRYPGSGGSM